jgi:hypothetical protein
MTAFGLIESIFSRPPWRGEPGNQRRITRDQLVYLRDLIDADPQAGAVKRGAPGSLVWTPAGSHKFVLSEDLAGDKHTLTRLSNITAGGTGMLF